MDRRRFIGQGALYGFLLANPWADISNAQMLQIEEGAPHPEPIPESHFPDRLHLFVWRNWELANAERLAQVLATTPEKVVEIGASMGLPRKPQLSEDQLRRFHITVIRQNWHILADDQLIELLGWDRRHYEYTLREDDFAWIKLGSLKPRCLPLRYAEPTAEVRRRAAEIKEIVTATFGSALEEPGEPAFRFVAELSSAPMEERQGPHLAAGSVRPARLDPRLAYSYFALYGDPLMEPGIDPFPDGFLDKLARAGINGVWMQGVLRNLAPSGLFPEFGEGSETRLENLRRLVDRAGRYGVKVYLYMNEPRAMPAEFFARHPEVKGTHDESDPGYFALCTSTPKVRQWVSDSLAHLFAQAPKLGGIFCITASENLTNCYSHGQARFCPRCSQRDGADVVAELIWSLRDGVRRSSSEAKVIAWDWGWGQDWVAGGVNTESMIRQLPADVALLSVSEWNKPINRGGFPTKVGEYSISVVGPGPRATRNWQLARQRGLATMAKVQWSTTWEISAVPYVPVPNLIVEHCQKLAQAGIEGLLASWTVGGYPSPNFEAAREFYFSPAPDPAQVLRQLAVRRYGEKATPGILQAWTAFSQAFAEFPMEGGGVVYHLPTQHGPSNLLRLQPTGYKTTMMLFPYDDFKGWVGGYPVDVAQQQLEKVATLWQPGLETFRGALPLVPPHQQAAARRDLGVAETCYLHFRSSANQIRFYRLRQALESAAPETPAPIAAQMAQIAGEEIELAKRQYAIARGDSTIAYEASNHYYYRPLDLVEKVLNCRQVMEDLQKS